MLLQAAEDEREKELQRVAENARSRGSSRMAGLGRGDGRNFSGGNQVMPPPDTHSRVGMDDIRRLGRGSSRQTSSQGTISFGPSSMFNTNRGSNTRNKTLGVPGGLLSRTGEDSGSSSRTGTPPVGRDKKERDEKEAATHSNAFR
jgi:translation initiation factor 4G